MCKNVVEFNFKKYSIFFKMFDFRKQQKKRKPRKSKTTVVKRSMRLYNKRKAEDREYDCEMEDPMNQYMFIYVLLILKFLFYLCFVALRCS